LYDKWFYDVANSAKARCVFSNDTDVLVLLFGVSGDGAQGADGTVGYDNAGPQCLQ